MVVARRRTAYALYSTSDALWFCSAGDVSGKRIFFYKQLVISVACSLAAVLPQLARVNVLNSMWLSFSRNCWVFTMFSKVRDLKIRETELYTISQVCYEKQCWPCDSRLRVLSLNDTRSHNIYRGLSSTISRRIILLGLVVLSKTNATEQLRSRRILRWLG